MSLFLLTVTKISLLNVFCETERQTQVDMNYVGLTSRLYDLSAGGEKSDVNWALWSEVRLHKLLVECVQVDYICVSVWPSIYSETLLLYRLEPITNSHQIMKYIFSNMFESKYLFFFWTFFPLFCMC